MLLRYLFLLVVLFNGSIANGQKQLQLKSAYKGGEYAFYYLFASQLTYTDNSTLGLTILSWKVENGKVDSVSVLNSLGKKTDKEVLRVIKLTENNWNPSASAAHYYLPIKFRTSQLDYFVDEFPPSFLPEVVVISLETRNFKSDDFLVSKLNKLIKHQKFEKSLPVLDELILRNPFSQLIRETRIYCLNQLKSFDLACQDVTFLENYLGAASKYPCIENY